MYKNAEAEYDGKMCKMILGQKTRQKLFCFSSMCESTFSKTLARVFHVLWNQQLR